MAQLVVHFFSADPEQLHGGYAPFKSGVVNVIEAADWWILVPMTWFGATGSGPSKEAAIEDLRAKVLNAFDESHGPLILTITPLDESASPVGSNDIADNDYPIAAVQEVFADNQPEITGSLPSGPGVSCSEVIEYQEGVNKSASAGDQLSMFDHQ
ncbi:hypothetical protein EZI54_07320 [Marinobacter halodurans]|uniref:Flavodoxin-like domain-containing protein n=1 Tax=Marinobacter halodurans TaxID=2528979 RepID=A0ABY1ZR56_9GAMM|nr:hypothetical protein [Marinobacter halodurans]TBW57461.1 hypothetical protein EZI54_07320 [Marinobacter halodurans]